MSDHSLSLFRDQAASPTDSAHSALPLYSNDPPPYPYPSPPSYPFPPDQTTSAQYLDFPSDSSPSPSSDLPAPSHREPKRSAARITIAHPYARLYAKKDGSKRRKIWNHVLEKQLFNSQELSTMGAPHRRTIYIASLEAHIDRLHNQLLSMGLYPIPFDKLEPYRGLNSKTAKSMVAGLQHDATHTKLKILELERSVGFVYSPIILILTPVPEHESPQAVGRSPSALSSCPRTRSRSSPAFSRLSPHGHDGHEPCHQHRHPAPHAIHGP
ncbi:hypothetical protein BJ138DRAFT_997141 [Hygrophoropsis aurantiaca]|uniref:Uncharacterized protein n=1 Tax=Hygrophoropsis aurantiaca TaxID=72124 RepID=A0ACB8AQM9_9AGAM|nr:hypothetical protein BJ138DRAFT_997141 [Hygrophoropsis aurantiaca]